MNVMLPHHKSHVFLLGLLLIDFPVVVAIAVLGLFFGFAHVYNDVMDWRMQHLWSMIPSVLLAVWLGRRWWKAR